MAPPKLSTLVQRLEGYRTGPGKTPTARIGKRLLLGHEVTADDMIAEGRTAGLLSVLLQDFRRCGYMVEETLRSDEDGRTRSVFRVTGQRPVDDLLAAEVEAEAERAARVAAARARRNLPDARALSPEPRKVRRAPMKRRPGEVIDVGQGVTHPDLGAALTVKVLALTDDHGLVMHLANGSAVWQVAVIGHVAR